MREHKRPPAPRSNRENNEFTVVFTCKCRLVGIGAAPVYCPKHAHGVRQLVTRVVTLDDALVDY